jgi:hypothetical protein
MHRSEGKGRAGLRRWSWTLLTCLVLLGPVVAVACEEEEEVEEATPTVAAETPEAEEEEEAE